MGGTQGPCGGLQQQAVLGQPTDSAELAAGLLASHRTSSSVVPQLSQLHGAESEAASLIGTGSVSSKPIRFVPLAIESYALGKFSFKVRQPGALPLSHQNLQQVYSRWSAKHPLTQNTGVWYCRASQKCVRFAR